MTTFEELIKEHPIVFDAISFSFHDEHKELEQQRSYLDTIVWLIKNTMDSFEEMSVTIKDNDVMLLKIGITYMKERLGERSWDERVKQLNELEAYLDTIEFK